MGESEVKLNKTTQKLKEVNQNYEKITHEYSTLMKNFQQTTNELRMHGDKLEEKKSGLNKVITDQKKKMSEHKCVDTVSKHEMMQKLKEKDETFKSERDFLTSQFAIEKKNLIESHKRELTNVTEKNVSLQNELLAIKNEQLGLLEQLKGYQEMKEMVKRLMTVAV